MTAAISMDTVGPDGRKATVEADYLIVACDPTGLPLVRTPEEGKVFSALQHFTFHTFTLKVAVPTGKVGMEPIPQFGVVLQPPMDFSDMNGKIYGYRNESAKQYSLSVANTLEHNYVVVYRLWNGDAPDLTDEAEEELLRRELGTLRWWPYGVDFEVVGHLRTPYFQHFDVAGVAEGLPWTYLGLQGKNATAYVHGSTCFESVVTIWQYIQLLFGTGGKGGQIKLPDQKARIVILGAGVSGVLMAAYLRKLGYRNVKVIEKNYIPKGNDTLIYGKTHSLVFHDAKPSDDAEPTVCEMGTCYMSPSYEQLQADLAQMLKAIGQPAMKAPRGFEVRPGEAGNFRGIALPDRAKPELFDDYVADGVRNWLGSKPGQVSDKIADQIIALAAAVYMVDQTEVMKGAVPMPTTPIDAEVAGQTFAEFLSKHDLDGLDTVMEYSYSIQGYGPLSQIPAFYGLVWMTGHLVLGEALDSLEHKPLVTFWPEGWGEVWRRLSVGLDIQDGTTVTAIRRKAVAEAA